MAVPIPLSFEPRQLLFQIVVQLCHQFAHPIAARNAVTPIASPYLHALPSSAYKQNSSPRTGSQIYPSDAMHPNTIIANNWKIYKNHSICLPPHKQNILLHVTRSWPASLASLTFLPLPKIVRLVSTVCHCNVPKTLSFVASLVHFLCVTILLSVANSNPIKFLPLLSKIENFWHCLASVLTAISPLLNN